MRTLFVLLLLGIAFAPLTHAGPMKVGDRELTFGLANRDVDRGSFFGTDLGDEDGLQADIRIGWMRTRVIQLGLAVSYVDLDGDDVPPGSIDDSIDGLTPSIFMALHIPTRGKTVPFGRFSIGIPQNDLGDRYEWFLGASIGLKHYPSNRFGFAFEGGYESLNGEDLVPDGDALHYGAALLFKF